MTRLVIRSPNVSEIEMVWRDRRCAHGGGSIKRPDRRGHRKCDLRRRWRRTARGALHTGAGAGQIKQSITTKKPQSLGPDATTIQLCT